MASRSAVETLERVSSAGSQRYLWGGKTFRFNRFRELATGYPSFNSPIEDKRALSAEISMQTEQYLAAGGTINIIPQGVSALPDVGPVSRSFLEREIDWPDPTHYRVNLGNGFGGDR